jgi:hypothetical protein
MTIGIRPTGEGAAFGPPFSFAYAACAGVFRAPRQPRKPSPANPASIMAQVEGSGTAGGRGGIANASPKPQA